MSALPPDLVSELRKILDALEQDLHVAIPRILAVQGAIRASLEGDALLVPEVHVNHWRRFQVMPSALVRDVAYAAKKRSSLSAGRFAGAAVEADAMAYSERFLRAVGEGDVD